MFIPFKLMWIIAIVAAVIIVLVFCAGYLKGYVDSNSKNDGFVT